MVTASAIPPPNILALGDLRFDVDRGQIRHGDAMVRIQPMPARLWLLFAAHPNRVLTARQIRNAIHPGQERCPELKRTYIHQARCILKQLNSACEIVCHRGYGWEFVTPARRKDDKRG